MFIINVNLTVCTAHKTCKAGEWTKATGTETADTMCALCEDGTFREEGPTKTDAEREADVCIIHKTCKAGEWTKTTGTAVTDTTCAPCEDGTFRSEAPMTTDAERVPLRQEQRSCGDIDKRQ